MGKNGTAMQYSILKLLPKLQRMPEFLSAFRLRNFVSEFWTFDPST